MRCNGRLVSCDRLAACVLIAFVRHYLYLWVHDTDNFMRAYFLPILARPNIVPVFTSKTQTMKYFFIVAFLLAVVIAALDALHRWAVDFLSDVFRMK